MKPILDELKLLEPHDWAGDYHSWSGRGGTRVVLSPTQGYATHDRSCIATLAFNFGSIASVSDEWIAVTPTLTPEDAYECSTETRFARVRHGDRRLIVPESDLVAFCNSLNAGEVDSWWGLYRKHDEEAKIYGTPVLPDEYRAYLLERPIQGSISKVHSKERTITDGKRAESVVTISIDKGASAAVLVGMRFFLEGHSPYTDARVTAVAQDECTAVIREDHKPTDSPFPGGDPSIGLRVSTRKSTRKYED